MADLVIQPHSIPTLTKTLFRELDPMSLQLFLRIITLSSLRILSYWGDKLTSAQIALQPLFDPGHVKNVIIYAKLDDVARYADLTSAAVQIAAIRSSDWNLIQANPQKFSFFTNPAWGGLVSALGLNTQIYPTNITAVRQAIVHSLNYTDIAQKAFLGEMSSYVGPEYPAWQSFYDLGNFSQYSYNTTLATQLLSQANVTSPTLTMNIASSCSFCTNLAEAVQSDLSVVGINVQNQRRRADIILHPVRFLFQRDTRCITNRKSRSLFRILGSRDIDTGRLLGDFR